MFFDFAQLFNISNKFFQWSFPINFLPFYGKIANWLIHICDKLSTDIVETTELGQIVCKMPNAILGSCCGGNDGNVGLTVNHYAVILANNIKSIHSFLVKW